MPMRASEWREDAIGWIKNHAANLPSDSSDRWKATRPTDQACDTAVQAIKVLGPDAPAPSALLVTLMQGIEIEWRSGDRLLSVQIMPDGSLESLKSIGGEPIQEERLFEPDSRIHNLVTWVKGSV